MDYLKKDAKNLLNGKFEKEEGFSLIQEDNSIKDLESKDIKWEEYIKDF